MKIDIRNGKPFSDDVVGGHYAYDVRSWPNGAELFLNRTNRRQQIMESLRAARPTARAGLGRGMRSGRPVGLTTAPPCSI